MALAISQRPLLRIVVLCILYCAQGIPFGFITYALIAWLVERGADTAGVALITVASTLPWSFKWLWGPIVDRFQIPRYGKRRPWIIFAQCMMILTALCLGLVPEPAQSLWAIASLIFIHNVFSGLQDVAVDALAVDLLRPQERGRANGLMYGSKYGGTALGALTGSVVLPLSGGELMPSLLVMAAMVALIMCVPLFIRERPGEQLLPTITPKTGHLIDDASQTDEASENMSVLRLLARLFRAFKRRNTIMAAILGLLIWVPNGMVYPVSMTLFINKLGWTQQSYTSVTGTWGLAAGLICSVGGGFLADLIGARTLAGIAAILLGLLLAIFGFAPDSWWQNTQFISFYLVAEQGIQGTLSVSLFAIFMSVTWRIVAATQFTAYMALLNLSYSLGSIVSPALENIGIRQVYLIAACLQVSVIVVLPFCKPWRTREEDVPRCGNCDYSLVGLPGESACPECGSLKRITK